MSDPTSKAPFLDRFEHARSVILRGEIRHGAWWTLCAAACGIGLLAAADYWFELSRPARAVGLGLVGCAAAAAAVRLLVAPMLWWSRPRTAAEIEHRFPQLGQRVRTVVQFSGRPESSVASHGVAPTLVAALEDDTEVRARPLDLAAVYPWWKLRMAAAAAVAPILLLLLLAIVDWEARLAIVRALLGNRPYTEVVVTPGDSLLDQGKDLAVAVELRGRTDRPVQLDWRPAEEPRAPWSQLELSPEDARSAPGGALQYQAKLEKLDRPTEYRARAGPAQSGVYRVDIRYPLAMKKFEVELTPPAYTQLEPRVVPGGDLQAIEGSTAEFRVEMDGPCSEASLVVQDLPSRAGPGQQEPEPKSISMKLDGGILGATLELQRDAAYWLVARSNDGRQLPENRYRIHVRRDQPPSVRFEAPDEALEVHPLVEVLMRARASDDFGLSKAGIVFHVDNGEEQTLLVQDFTSTPGPGKEKGKPSPTLRAVCDTVLALENVQLTPQQSVTYYAFAEDNYPGGARRAETDLRFIDIRPFLRIYKVGGT